MWAVFTHMFTGLWGPQSRSSRRGEWVKCLHGYGSFKFQVRFRVESNQCGLCNLFQIRSQLKQYIEFFVDNTCMLGGASTTACLEWKGPGEWELQKDSGHQNSHGMGSCFSDLILVVRTI